MLHFRSSFLGDEMNSISLQKSIPPPSDNPAVAHCHECSDLLCNECYEAHSKVKVTRHHKWNKIKRLARS